MVLNHSVHFKVKLLKWTESSPKLPAPPKGIPEMKEDKMDVEPCYPLFSAELESAEALASSETKF